MPAEPAHVREVVAHRRHGPARHHPRSRHPHQEAVLAAETEREDAARAAAMWRAFERLSGRCRELLRILMASPPPSYAEVAAALELPLGSIGPTRARCLQRLREEMAGIRAPRSASRCWRTDGWSWSPPKLAATSRACAARCANRGSGRFRSKKCSGRSRRPTAGEDRRRYQCPRPLSDVGKATRPQSDQAGSARAFHRKFVRATAVLCDSYALLPTA